MIPLIKDKINKIVLPGLHCSDNGQYNLSLTFDNNGQSKIINTVGELYNGLLRFTIEHVCHNIASTDPKINFDLGRYPVVIEDTDNNIIISTTQIYIYK